MEEGQCVFVPCNVTYPKHGYWQDSDPAYGYWFQKETDEKQEAPVTTNKPGCKVYEETQGRFHLLGDPLTYNCSLDIRDARKKDEGKYFFRVERGKAKWSYIYNLVSVHVTGREWAVGEVTEKGMGVQDRVPLWGGYWASSMSGLRKRN